MLQKLRNMKAFTIVELMVVVAIIAICVSVVIPVFLGIIDDNGSSDNNVQIEEPVKQQNEKPIKEETGRAL
jgi:prepilin-type N-terminal cleavage/methylation domain-containing protein